VRAGGVDYDKTHHSQADTLDRVRWDDLTEGAQVLAVFAYNVAQLPEMLRANPQSRAATKPVACERFSRESAARK